MTSDRARVHFLLLLCEEELASHSPSLILRGNIAIAAQSLLHRPFTAADLPIIRDQLEDHLNDK